MPLRFLSDIPADQKRITLATKVTLARIALTPFVVLALACHAWYWSFGLFLVAILSDSIDGNLARWRNEQTILGAYLDALADHLLIIATFSTLAIVGPNVLTMALPRWLIMLVLLRHVGALCGVALAYLLTGKRVVTSTPLSKVMTVIQAVLILWLIAYYAWAWVSPTLHLVMIVVTSGFIGLLFIQYLLTAITLFSKKADV